METKKIQTHKDRDVYNMAFKAAMEIFELTKKFPSEEKYSLTDQIRRSSRSVCANIAEAWRKRRYDGSFMLKLNDSEAEAAETQTWLDFAVASGYLSTDKAQPLYQQYDFIIGKLVNMIARPEPWLLPVKKR